MPLNKETKQLHLFESNVHLYKKDKIKMQTNKCWPNNLIEKAFNSFIALNKK